MDQEHAFCLAIERLLGITPPIWGQLIRVLYSEIGRVLSHILRVSFLPCSAASTSCSARSTAERNIAVGLRFIIFDDWRPQWAKRGRQGRASGAVVGRKAQMAVEEYKREGGGYVGSKSESNSLVKWWTEEDTKSGDKTVLEGEAVLMVPARAHKTRIRNERGGMDVVHGWHDVPQQRHLTRLLLTRRGDRQGKGEVVVGKPDGRGRRGSLCVPAPRGPHRLGRQRP